MTRRTRNHSNAIVVAACCAAAAAAATSSSVHAGTIFPKVQKSSKAKSAKSAKLVSDAFPPPTEIVDVEESTTMTTMTTTTTDEVDDVDVKGEDDRSSSSAVVPPPPSPRRSTSCIDIARYREIYDDVEIIAERIDDPMEQAHFYGSIVRLVAHDFMDYDASSASDPMGSDGCIDWSSLTNAGLNTIWHEGSELYLLWSDKYSDISWADFWIMTANSVIYKTSEEDANGGKLDLVDTFLWGRDDAS